jgi:hypothetical protein
MEMSWISPSYSLWSQPTPEMWSSIGLQLIRHDMQRWTDVQSWEPALCAWGISCLSGNDYVLRASREGIFALLHALQRSGSLMVVIHRTAGLVERSVMTMLTGLQEWGPHSLVLKVSLCCPREQGELALLGVGLDSGRIVRSVLGSGEDRLK